MPETVPHSADPDRQPHPLQPATSNHHRAQRNDAAICCGDRVPACESPLIRSGGFFTEPVQISRNNCARQLVFRAISARLIAGFLGNGRFMVLARHLRKDSHTVNRVQMRATVFNTNITLAGYHYE